MRAGHHHARLTLPDDANTAGSGGKACAASAPDNECDTGPTGEQPAAAISIACRADEQPVAFDSGISACLGRKSQCSDRQLLGACLAGIERIDNTINKIERPDIVE